MAADLSKMQAEALKARQALLDELGLGEVEDEGEQLSSRAREARKRGTEVKSRAAAAAPPMRTSMRVRGMAPDGSALPERPAGYVGAYVVEAPRARPEGDVPVLSLAAPGYTKAEGVLAVLRAAPEVAAHAAASAAAAAAASTDAAMTSSSSSSSSSSAAAASPSRSRAAGEKRAGGGASSAGASPSAASASRGAAAARGGGGGLRDASTLAALQIRSMRFTMKALPDTSNRVYSVGFHPCADKLVAIVGGRFGELSLWCPDLEAPSPDEAGAAAPSATKRPRKAGAGEEEEEEAGDEDGEGEGEGSATGRTLAKLQTEREKSNDTLSTLAVFRLHAGTVNSFIVPRTSPHHILTTSYDGSIRLLDVNSGMSFLVHEDDNLPSFGSLDSWSADGGGDGVGGGHCLYVGNRDGEVYHLDTRIRGGKTGAIQAHEKKVTAVSLQAGGLHVLTSCSDATVKIWDARRLPRHIASASRANPKAQEPLSVLAHGQAVTGAAFSPTGRYIGTVSNDNKVRVWDVSAGGSAASSAAAAEPVTAVPRGAATHSVYHNNHTGRWLSPFKVGWDPKAEGTLLLGNMDRAVDIFSVKADDLDLVASITHKDYQTAVTTQVAAHPTMNAVIGGTASGRAYIWT